MKPVTMMQAGDGAHLKGFIAGPFNVKVGQSTHHVDLYGHPQEFYANGNGFSAGPQGDIYKF